MSILAPVNLREKTKGIGGRLLYWEYIERVRKSMKWNVHSVAHFRDQWLGKALLICGGGPSLKADLDRIRAYQKQGAYVLTVNKTHDYFLNLDQPIIPWGHVLLDPKPWVAEYVKKPHPDVKYFIASSCDPSVMRRIRLANGRAFLWHAGANFYGQVMPILILEQEFPDKIWAVTAGPTTVGLRSLVLGYQFGFRRFHLFGLDSSMAKIDGEFKLHAYEKDRPTDSEEGVVTLNTKLGKYDFYTNSHMSQQALDFEDLIDQIGTYIKDGRWDPVDIQVHGEGLLPSYAASIGLHANPDMNREYCGKEAA